jgi:hypothetical protein
MCHIESAFTVSHLLYLGPLDSRIADDIRTRLALSTVLPHSGTNRGSTRTARTTLNDSSVSERSHLSRFGHVNLHVGSLHCALSYGPLAASLRWLLGNKQSRRKYDVLVLRSTQCGRLFRATAPTIFLVPLDAIACNISITVGSEPSCGNAAKEKGTRTGRVDAGMGAPKAPSVAALHIATFAGVWTVDTIHSVLQSLLRRRGAASLFMARNTVVLAGLSRQLSTATRHAVNHQYARHQHCPTNRGEGISAHGRQLRSPVDSVHGGCLVDLAGLWRALQLCILLSGRVTTARLGFRWQRVQGHSVHGVHERHFGKERPPRSRSCSGNDV